MIYRKTKNVNIKLFTNDLRKSALCQHYPDSLHELVNLYNTTLSNTLDLHASVVTRTIKSRPHVPWYSVEIKEARKKHPGKPRGSQSRKGQFLKYRTPSEATPRAVRPKADPRAPGDIILQGPPNWITCPITLVSCNIN